MSKDKIRDNIVKYVPLIIVGVMVLFFLIVFITNFVGSSSVPRPGDVDDTYYYENIDYKYEVTSDKKVKVNIDLTAVFNTRKQGIILDLPRNSGEKYDDVRITSGQKMSVISEGDFLRLKIGSKGKYLTGNHEYSVSYTMVLPGWTTFNDELYLNLVPFGFDTYIEDFKVLLAFPEGATPTYDTVSGKIGVEDNNANVVVRQETETIKGVEFFVMEPSSDTGIALQAFSGVTSRMQFEDGVFTLRIEWNLVILGIMGIVIIILTIVFAIRGREDELIAPVAFKAPRGLYPCEVGYIIDGDIDQEDITCMIFYWANEGLIKIDIDEIDPSNTKLIKVREYYPPKGKDGNDDIYDQELFDGLFESGNVVRIADLDHEFGSVVSLASSKLKEDMKKYSYTKISKTMSTGLTVAACALPALMVGLDYLSSWVLNVPNIIMGIVLSALLFAFSSLGGIISRHDIKHDKKKHQTHIIIYGVASVALMAIIAAVFTYLGKLDIMTSILVSIASVFPLILTPFILKRDPEYCAILGEIQGFRNFILLAEKDKLETMIEEYPEFYYKVLPYAQVMGVSEVWQDKFKDIPLTAPSWDNSPSGRGAMFNYVVFSSAINSANSIMRSASSAKPPSSSSSSGGGGGGFSGGGSSGGGGFGGGGGSSW